MFLGPIHSVLPGLATGHNPVKDIKVAGQPGKQIILFDQEYPFGLQSAPQEASSTLTIYEATQAAGLARLQQLKELFRNKEWERCGIFIQWREDGVSDPDDGWYSLANIDVSDDYIFSGYGEPKIDVLLRAQQRTSIGVLVDAKAVPNDANLVGTTLAAYPMGLTNLYPFQSYTYAGANGSIQVVESPTSIIRGDLSSASTLQTQGRCKVADETVNGSTSTEVFWRDHRNINGYYRVSNDLLRYTIQEAAGVSPLIEAWDPIGAAWTTLGNYQLQTTNTGPILPLQSVVFQTISPEEVIWTERRFDVAGTALVVVTNRIRRGSRLIESSIVAASGAGLTGTQSVAIVNAPNVTWTLGTSADSTGAAMSSVYLADGLETSAAVSTGLQLTGTSASEPASSFTDLWQARGIWSKASNIISAPVTAGKNQLIYGTSAGSVVGGLDASLYKRQVRINATQIGAGAMFYVQSLDNSYVVKADGANTVGLYKNVAGTLTQIGSSLSFAWTAAAALWLLFDGTAAGTVTFGAATDTAGAPGAFTTQAQADTTYTAGGVGYYNDGTGTVPTFGGAFANVDRTQSDLKGWVTVADAASNYDGWLYAAKTSPYAGTWCGGLFVPGGGNVDATHRSGALHVTTCPNATMTAVIQVKAAGGLGYQLFFQPAVTQSGTGNGAWQKVTVTGTASASAAQRVYATSAGTLYFDNALFYQSPVVPGFCFLTSPPNAATTAGQSLYSGSTVPAGTVTRLALLAGIADDQYVAMLTAAAYAQRFANYSRTRVRQRILIGN